MGPGNVGLGAAIAEMGPYVSPPSVDFWTTTLRGACWLYESRTVWSSVNVIHWRSAPPPWSVTPFPNGPPVVRLCPLFGEVEVTNPVRGPRPV